MNPPCLNYRRPDPRPGLKGHAKQLQTWAEETGRQLREGVYRRHQRITAAERLLANDRGDERGWLGLAHAYHGLARLEWLLDLLDSERPEDWRSARSILPVSRLCKGESKSK